MQTFLDGPFAGLFDPAAWSGTWSGASDQNVRSRISTSELIETSVNANDAAFRKLASAYTMVADLGTDKLNQNAFQAVVDTAMRAVSEAVQGITELQARLGTAQERVKNANDRMSIQIDIMTNHIGVLEGVDPYEASNRVAGAADAGRDRLRHDGPHPEAEPAQLPAAHMTVATTDPGKKADVPVLLRRSARRDPEGRARARAPGHRPLDRAAAGRPTRPACARARRSRPSCSCAGCGAT